jgi:hypothetical protein
MKFKELTLLCAVTAFGVVAVAQDFTVTILIQKRLTKPSVTPSVSVISAARQQNSAKMPKKTQFRMSGHA